MARPDEREQRLRRRPARSKSARIHFKTAQRLRHAGGRTRRDTLRRRAAKAFHCARHFEDAPILILDEPTSALDAQTEHLLLDAMERLRKGRTTLFIAHRLSTVRRADLVVVLKAGRIEEIGTHEQLMARGELYARFHNVQFERHQPGPAEKA
jgi:ABC-type sugar transport system ATPase subunit